MRIAHVRGAIRPSSSSTGHFRHKSATRLSWGSRVGAASVGVRGLVGWSYMDLWGGQSMKHVHEGSRTTARSAHIFQSIPVNGLTDR